MYNWLPNIEISPYWFARLMKNGTIKQYFKNHITLSESNCLLINNENSNEVDAILNGECIGLATNEFDDEPCDQCKGCGFLYLNKEGGDSDE